MSRRPRKAVAPDPPAPTAVSAPTGLTAAPGPPVAPGPPAAPPDMGQPAPGPSAAGPSGGGPSAPGASGGDPSGGGPSEPSAGAPRFLAETYRDRFPDLQKIAAERPDFDFEAHYIRHGRAETRHLAEPLKGGVDVALISGGGFLFLSGWLDDSMLRRNLFTPPELTVTLRMAFYEAELPAAAVMRSYRRDIKEGRGLLEDADLGFVILVPLPAEMRVGDRLDLTIACAGRRLALTEIAPKIVSDGYLVSYYLGFFRALEAGRHRMGACMEAYGRHGAALVALWRAHLAGLAPGSLLDLGVDREAGPETGPEGAERSGPERSGPTFSVLLVLYGKLEFFQAQCATLIARLAQAGGELIAVLNSPGLAVEAVALARHAHAAFGIPIRLLIMEGNAGFGAANNRAARLARSDRLICLNPDVFARPDTDFDALTARLAALGPREIVGARLHYADGTVMHEGMTILADPAPRRLPPAAPLFSEMLLRVDHPLKGVPPDLDRAAPAPVEQAERAGEPGSYPGQPQTASPQIGAPLGKAPNTASVDTASANPVSAGPLTVEAVTGSFLMIRRTFFDDLGGFSPDYVMAYYEDADLCLRARAAGGQVRLDPAIALTHLEGRGSGQGSGQDGPGTALPAMLFNRCLFTDRHADQAMRDAGMSGTGMGSTGMGSTGMGSTGIDSTDIGGPGIEDTGMGPAGIEPAGIGRNEESRG